MKRFMGNMNGERYCGNTNKKEVHDLEDENGLMCQIDDIIKAGHDKPFDSLANAHTKGYDYCYWCIGDSRR